MKKVLSIDGGGLHGILPATVLAHIEALAEKPIYKMFDLIVGTSTGGILALGLSTPLRSSVLLELYTKRAREIFYPRWFRSPWIWRSKYKADSLEGLLKFYYGPGRSLGSLKVPTMVTSYDLKHRRPVMIKSWTSPSALVWKAARATSAAPTYFPPAEGGLIDGGMFTNNPAMSAYAEARSLFPEENIYLLSLGCGENTRPINEHKARGWGLAGWAPHIIGIMMDGQSDEANRALSNMPGLTLDRIQTKLIRGSDDFDNSKLRNIVALQDDARRMVEEHKFLIDDIAKGK